MGLVVSDKKIFENCILKTYFLTPWPTYATNWNGLNNFDRGTPRDHSCEVWSKSNELYQRRSRLNENVFARTHAHTVGRRTNDCHKFGQNPRSGFRGDVVKRNCWRTDWRWATDNGPSQKLTLSTLCSGELKTVCTKYVGHVGHWRHIFQLSVVTAKYGGHICPA